MSRTIVVRRLTAVIVLLAVLGLALPAAAASGRHHSSPRPSVVHSSSLFDQFLSWVGSFLPGQAPISQGPTEKAGSKGSGTDSVLPLAASDADHGGMIDPNG